MQYICGTVILLFFSCLFLTLKAGVKLFNTSFSKLLKSFNFMFTVVCIFHKHSKDSCLSIQARASKFQASVMLSSWISKARTGWQRPLRKGKLLCLYVISGIAAYSKAFKIIRSAFLPVCEVRI